MDNDKKQRVGQFFYPMSKMHEEKCTFTWHTYSDHLQEILKEMRSDDSFADVTLVTDDKKQLYN